MERVKLLFDRADIADGPSDAGFDCRSFNVEDIRCCLLARSRLPVMDQLGFERVKETLQRALS